MICKNCGKENEDGLTFCQYCGKRLDGKKICPNCGAVIDEEAKYCGVCGADTEKEVGETAAADAAEKTATPDKEKVKKALDIAGLALVCFAALIGFIFTLCLGIKTTGETSSADIMIYSYFGEAYEGLSFEGLNSAQRALTIAPNIFGTVIAAGVIVSVVAFTVLMILELVKKFRKKQESEKLAKYATAIYISFAVAATLFLALHAMTMSVSSSGRTSSQDVTFSGATLAGLILGGIALGGHYVCRAVNNRDIYCQKDNLTDNIILFVAAVLAVVVTGLTALPVINGSYTGAYSSAVKISVSYVLASTMALSAGASELTALAASVIIGYISQIIIAIVSVIIVLNFVNSAVGGMKGKFVLIKAIILLVFCIVNLVCSIVAANAFKEALGQEMIMSFGAPIAMTVLSALVLAAVIAGTVLSKGKKATPEVAEAKTNS